MDIFFTRANKLRNGKLQNDVVCLVHSSGIQLLSDTLGGVEWRCLYGAAVVSAVTYDEG